MDAPFVKLTPTDRKILESYAFMLDGLGAYLGEGYEIVLHSLESLDHSVIKIINGEYTGRKIGSPITDLALKMLGELEKDPMRTVSPYFNKNKNGSFLRSCTIPITGERGRIIGLLCMNFHMEAPFATIMQNLIPTPEATLGAQATAETFSDNIDDLILTALAAVSYTHLDVYKRQVQNLFHVGAAHLPGLRLYHGRSELLPADVHCHR